MTETREFKLNQYTEIEQIHNKLVTAATVDPSGSRLATSSLDYSVKLWSFSGMQKKVKYFRKVVPVEGIGIRSVQWNSSGSQLLVCPATNIAFVYDREGKEITKTNKGDMYIKDLNHTAGHTCQINGGCWDYAQNSHFLTWGNDGALRLWDQSRPKKNLRVLKIKNRQNKKFPCTSGIFCGTSKIVGGCEDGSISVWDYKNPFRPKVIKKAHEAGYSINSLLCKGENVYSKSLRGEIKKWDLRAIKSPVATYGNFENDNEFSKMAFSPSSEKIAATSFSSERTRNKLIVLSSANLGEEEVVELPNAAISVEWSSKLNQILAITADRGIHFRYDGDGQQVGAAIISKENRVHYSDDETNIPIDRELVKEMRKAAKEGRYERRKVSRPEVAKDEMKTLARNSFASGLFKRLKPNTMRDQDPREALLRYERKAKEQPLLGKKE